MSAINLRTEIMHLLQKESNERLLAKISSLLKREGKTEDWDPTDEEVAELDAEHEKAVRCEGPAYPWEEVKRKAREALKK